MGRSWEDNVAVDERQAKSFLATLFGDEIADVMPVGQGEWYERIGLTVPRFKERLRCYELHIGLSGQAYCAFAGHWGGDLQWTARHTLAITRQTQ